MSFGTTPLSTTTLGANQFPASAVYIQGTSGGNFTVLQGGPASTADTSGNISAPASMYTYDGNNVTLGTTTDLITANTLIGLTKAIKANTASVAIGTLPALPAGGNTIGNVGLVAGSALIGGVELVDSAGTNKASISAAGALKVDNSGVTQPISGTVTANAGTGTFTVAGTVTANIGTTNGLALDSSVNGVLLAQGSTTSGEKGPLIQGAVTTSSPTYTTAQTSPLSLTPAGALRVDGSATIQPVSGTFWQATQPVSGTVTANAGTGTFTVAGTVTANIGTTNGLALDSSVNGVLLAQGSTTSGEKGPLIQGAVTTASPTYTTAQTSPLSLTTAGALRVDASATTQPVSGTITANAGSGTFTVAGTVTANQGGAPWSDNITQFGGTNLSTGTGAGGAGIPRVTVSNDSNVLATQSGTWTVQPGNTPNTTAWLFQPVVGTSGGATPSHTITASGTNATSLKASAGQVYNLQISNGAASACYFRFYNSASAPTVGTTPIVKTIQVPANGTVVVAWPDGLAFSTGIAWSCTGAIGDADTTSISTNVSVDIDYK